MFIRIDENGTSTTSADQNEYSIVFGDILLIIYSIISVILLAIVVILAIRSHHNKTSTTSLLKPMNRNIASEKYRSEHDTSASFFE